MSFVNDVMSEEADRKGLILFEECNLLHDLGSSTELDIEEKRKKYLLNFIIIVLSLIGIIQFVDQLPVSERTSQIHQASHAVAVQDSVSFTGQVVAAQASTEQSVIDQPKSEPAMNSVHVNSEKNQSEKIQGSSKLVSSNAEKKIKKSEEKLTATSVNPALDFTDKRVVFNKQAVNSSLSIEADLNLPSIEALIAAGNTKQAIADLKKLLVIEPENIPAVQLLASSYFQQGQKQQAMQAYKNGLLNNSSSPELAQPLAHLLVESGEVEQALQVLIKAAPSPRVDPDYSSMIAALYQQSGNHDQAVAVYQKILNVQSDNGKWWLGLGISLMATAKDRQALSAFEWSLRDEAVPAALKQFARQRINDLKIRTRL